MLSIQRLCRRRGGEGAAAETAGKNVPVQKKKHMFTSIQAWIFMVR